MVRVMLAGESVERGANLGLCGVGRNAQKPPPFRPRFAEQLEPTGEVVERILQAIPSNVSAGALLLDAIMAHWAVLKAENKAVKSLQQENERLVHENTDLVARLKSLEKTMNEERDRRARLSLALSGG